MARICALRPGSTQSASGRRCGARWPIEVRMAPIERETGRGRWEGEEYFLTQEFVFSEPRVALDAREILREADALVNQRSQAATLWLARWRDDSLMLGPICILR